MRWRFLTYAAAPIRLALVVLLLAACQRLPVQTGSKASVTNRFSVHLASVERSDDLTLQEVGPDGEPIFLSAAPLITEADVVHASASTAIDGRPSLVLDLSYDGTVSLRSESEAYVGRFLAFLWDGQVVYCPRVQNPLGSKLMIVGGTRVLPSEIMHEIADRINSSAAEPEEDK